MELREPKTSVSATISYAVVLRITRVAVRLPSASVCLTPVYPQKPVAHLFLAGVRKRLCRRHREGGLPQDTPKHEKCDQDASPELATSDVGGLGFTSFRHRNFSPRAKVAPGDPGYGVVEGDIMGNSPTAAQEGNPTRPSAPPPPPPRSSWPGVENTHPRGDISIRGGDSGAGENGQNRPLSAFLSFGGPSPGPGGDPWALPWPSLPLDRPRQRLRSRPALRGPRQECERLSGAERTAPAGGGCLLTLSPPLWSTSRT